MLYKQTTSDLEKMNRTDLVFEAAKKAHIDHYHTIITWPTEMIRNLLIFYRDTDNSPKTARLVFKTPMLKSIDINLKPNLSFDGIKPQDILKSNVELVLTLNV